MSEPAPSTSASSRSFEHLLRRPSLTFRAACQRACRPALVGTGCGFLLFAILSVTLFRPAGSSIDVVWLLLRSCASAVVVGGGVFAVWLLSSMRGLLDRSFELAAMSTTLFGCVMLLTLFWRLAIDASAWFQTTPALVNQATEAHAAQVHDLEAFIRQQLEEVDREMESELKVAASDEERREIRDFYEQRIMPRKKADLNATALELKQAQQKTPRTTSGMAVFGHFLTSGPSNEPQDAGIYPALLGSIFVGLIAMFMAVPLGVGAAIYLEEYQQKGWLGKIIQINIRNLAGIPSVVYGIVGAYLFVELVFKHLEGELFTPMVMQWLLGKDNADGLMHSVFGHGIAARNVLGGGLTLGLLTLPIVIISSQEAIRAVPGSLRDASLALGATRWQTIRHHVLPVASPGILTGVILALSRALGEAAPLVLFGALLFVNHNPALFSRFTVLPMQIFGWVDRPAEAWRYNAALASLILILTVLALNAVAIMLRSREHRGGH
jgi:phosphate transport system permease protein